MLQLFIAGSLVGFKVSYSFGMLYLIMFLLRKTCLIVVWLLLLSATLLLS